MSNDAFQRCLKIVSLLNTEYGWGLTNETLRQYARKLATSFANIAGMSDVQLNVSIRYYHKDHALVEALLDTDHPEHAERWAEWTRQALSILAAKTAQTRLPDEMAVSLEDLAQEAILDLWRGLRNFSYQSSFHTWAFTVIGHCLARHYRTHQTQKRAALPAARSLDTMVATGDTFPNQTTMSPDTATFNTLLLELVNRVLRQHPDRRLAVVFHLWANEEQTLRVIGDRLALSPARVHALLKQAVALLRDEEAIRGWVERDVIREIVI